MHEYCINVYFQSILKMDVKKEVDEVSSVFSQHPTEVRIIDIKCSDPCLFRLLVVGTMYHLTDSCFWAEECSPVDTPRDLLPA